MSECPTGLRYAAVVASAAPSHSASEETWCEVSVGSLAAAVVAGSRVAARTAAVASVRRGIEGHQRAGPAEVARLSPCP